MSIVSNLPAVPDNDYSNYIIYTHDDNYYLTVFDDLETGIVNEQGALFYNSSRDLYSFDYDSGNWILNDTFWNGSYTFIGSDGYSIINSSVDIYNNDGTVFCYGSSMPYHDGISLIGGSLSGSAFVSVFGELWSVLPLLLGVVLCLVGFRKAFGFLRGLIRGA